MKPAAGKVEFEVNGRPCTGRAGESLLDALRRAGFEVPSLCHLSGLSPYGACRMCLVEVDKGGRGRLTTSCNYPLSQGLKVTLDTDRVQRHRQMVVALLSLRAPHAPALKALRAKYGSEEEARLDGPAQPDNCILCGLCTRICRQGARAEALVLAGRGVARVLASRALGEFPDDCIACGACAWVCPTGAISMEPEGVARLRLRRGQDRPCRYALLGLSPGAICENDYRCAQCQVDQDWIDRAGGRHPVMLLLSGRDGEG